MTDDMKEFKHNDLMVLAELTQPGFHTVRSVALACGIGVTTAWESCNYLRTCGLVKWERGTTGTLRANVRIVSEATLHHGPNSEVMRRPVRMTT